MAFRNAHSTFRPRHNRHHDTIDSGSNNLHVETHLTTPHSLVLPPLHSTLSDNGHIIRTHGDKGMMERKDRKVMSVTSLPQQHFFITPREVDLNRGLGNTGNSSICSGSIATMRSEEERNPRPERSVARSIFRTDRSLAGGNDDGDSYGDFSTKLRSEMRKVQTDMLGGNVTHHKKMHSESPETFFRESTSRQQPPMDSHSRPRPFSTTAAAVKSRGTQANLNLGDSRSVAIELRHRQDLVDRNTHLEKELAAKKSEIVAVKRENFAHEDHEHRGHNHRKVMERNRHLEQDLASRDSELRLKDSELATKDSQILELTRQLRSMQQTTKDKVESEKELARTYAKDLNDIEDEYKSALEETVTENDVLQKELMSSKAENKLWQKEIMSNQDQTKDQAKEIRTLREENEILKNEIDDMKQTRAIAEQGLKMEMRAIAEQDLQTSQRTIWALETKFEDAQRTIEDLKMGQRAMWELDSKYEECQSTVKELELECDRAMKEKMMLESKYEDSQLTIKELESRYEDASKEMMRLESKCEEAMKEKMMLESRYDDSQRTVKELESANSKEMMRLQSKCEGAVQEKMRLQSKYEETTKEIMRLESKCEETANLKMRHEMVVEGMKEDYKHVLEEKDGMKEDYKHVLKDKTRYERINEELKNEINESRIELNRMTKEHDALKDRMGLLDEVTEALEIAIDDKEEAAARCRELSRDHEIMRDAQESMTQRLQSTNESMAQELDAALDGKEDAIDLYNELMRKHTMLQNSKESDSHMTEMVTKQRDKFGAMMENYREEIERLKQTNRDLVNQRDDLKEELICVLETASVYRD